MAGALDVVGLIWSSAPVVGPVLRIKPAASPPTRFGALSLRHLRHAREVRPTPRRSLSLLPLLAARVDCERPHASPSRILSLPCSSTTTPLPSSPPPCQPGHSPSPASLHRRTPRGVCGPVFVPCRKKSRTGRCEGRRPAASSVARPPPRRRETTMAARCPSATGQGPAVRRRGAANRWLGVPAHRDVVDYICFRAVCFGWRACTPAPRDPNLRDPRLRPRGWVALYDGDAVRPDDACEIVFFHTRTARRLRVPLPELRGHRIAGFTDGLVILMHKLTTAVRVLQPFTRDVVDFQPLATLYHQVVRHKASLLDMNAAVCSSASSADSIAVVVWFPYTNVVLAADPGSSDWEVLHSGLYVGCALPFQGRLYATLSCSSEIVQLYPPRQNGPLENHVVIADAPHSAHVNLCNFYLVESGGRMLLAVRQPARYANGSEWNALDWSRRVVCRLYVIVDLNSQRCKLIPVKSIGDRALFLCGDRCLSVSASDLPSLSSNSVYSTLPQYPILVLSLATGLSERLAGSCQIHDGKERIRPSVRPFTIADHLITYCNPREWSKGLMFHEYHYIPQSFEELIKKIRAQARELRIPRIAVHSR